jgi:hypothetical protein
LLIRPQPEPGESWPGYLLRVAALNHLNNGLAHFAKVLGVSHLALIGSEPDIVLGRLGFASLKRDQEQLVKHGKGIRPLRNSLRASSARFCPKCIQEMHNKHLLARWDRAFQFKCEKHEVLLVDRCPTCSRPITHLRRSLLACDCGTSFLRMPSPISTMDFVAVYRILELQEIYVSTARTFESSTPADLAALIFCKRLELLSQPKMHDSSKRNFGRVSELFFRFEELVKIHDIFTRWPLNFHLYLERHQEAFNESPSPLLLSPPLSAAGLLRPVRAAIAERAFHVHRSLKPKRRSAALIQSSIDESVGIKYLIQSAGCSYDTARYWLDTGRLGPYEANRLPNGTIRYRIAKDKVQKAIQISRSVSSVKEMALVLGTTNDTIRLFVRAGAIHAIPFGRASYNFRVQPAEVVEYANKLLKCARLSTSLEKDYVVFSRAIRPFLRRKVRRLQNFLGAILGGQIPVRKVQRYVVCIDELLIDQSALRRWERENLG